MGKAGRARSGRAVRMARRRGQDAGLYDACWRHEGRDGATADCRSGSVAPRMPTSDLRATMVAVAVPRRHRHGSTVHSFRRGASAMTTRFHTVPRTRAGRAGCLVTCLLIALGATGSAAGSRSVAPGETPARGSSGYRVELTAIGGKEVTDLRIEIRPGAGRPAPRRLDAVVIRTRAPGWSRNRFDDPPQCPRLGRSRRDRASAPPRWRARPRRGARSGRSAPALVLRAGEHFRFGCSPTWPWPRSPPPCRR